jgi:hypothetical protein
MATKKKTVKKIIKKIVKKPAKKVTKKPAKKLMGCDCCEKCVEGKFVGKITHYFSDIKVAVIDLVAPIKDGDNIRIVGGEATDFEQAVKSMQIDHKEVKSAKKGQGVGMKVKEKVHEGYKVYKI